MTGSVEEAFAALESDISAFRDLGDEIAAGLDEGEYDRVDSMLARRRELLESFGLRLQHVGDTWLATPGGPTAEEHAKGRRIADALHALERGAMGIETALARAQERSAERLRSVRAGRKLVEHQARGDRGRPGGWCDVRR